MWQAAPTLTLKTTINVVKSRLSNSQEELEAFGPSGTLRWNAVAGADVYELWIYRDAARVAFAEASGPVRITQYQITSLTPGTTYYVQVYARVNGQYTVGDALPLTVTDKLDRARILNPQEELDAFATNGLLRWSPVTGATAYELWIFTNPNSSEIHESSGSLNQRSVPDAHAAARQGVLRAGVRAGERAVAGGCAGEDHHDHDADQGAAHDAAGAARGVQHHGHAALDGSPGRHGLRAVDLLQRGPRQDRGERGESRSQLHDAAPVQRRGVLRAGVRAGEWSVDRRAGRRGST